MILYKILNNHFRKRVFGHVFVLFFPILLSSCYKEIPYPFDAENREIVLTGFNNNEALFKIQLYYTAKVLDTSQNPINNANVYLYKNQQIIDTLEYVTENIDNKTVSYYKSTHYPEYENNYSIRSVTNDGKSVTTHDYIPNEPIVNNVQILENQFTIVQEGGYEIKYSKLKLTLTDIVPSQNLYEIKVSKYFQDYEENTNCYINDQYITDNEIHNDEKVININNAIIFSDRFFNQNSKDFEFFFSAWSPSNLTHYYIVEVKNISENYYRYIKDVNVYTADNEYFNVHNNINGGQGIFALYALKRDTITP